MELYTELQEAGIEMMSHESDLYFPNNEVTTAILAKYPTQKSIATTFWHNVYKTSWYDVPFANLRYWEEKINAGR